MTEQAFLTVPQEPNDPREFVKRVDDDGTFVFERVGIEDIDYTGRFGALVTSTTENTISIGSKYFAIDWDDDRFRVGDDVQIQSNDPDCYMWGEVIGKDTTWSPARLLIFVDDISRLTGTYRNWEIQVVARPKPGIEKDTSTTSIDPTGAGPFTFTVTAGKFFPLNGQVLIKATTDRTIILTGRVKGYGGTSLVIDKTATTATVSQAYTSWSIALLDAPPAKLPDIGAFALNVFAASATTITIGPGAIIDSTGRVDIVNTESITKDLTLTWSAGDSGGLHYLQSLAGTVSSSGTAVTGTGTAFTTDFYPISGGTYGSTITADGVCSAVNTVTNNTSLATATNLSASADTYARGGWYSGAGTTRYQLLIGLNPTSGDVDFFLCGLDGAGDVTGDRDPDYTYYAHIAFIAVTAGAISGVNVIYPKVTSPTTTRGDMIYNAGAGEDVRLAIGASGRILTSNGTDPVWSAPVVWTASLQTVSGSTIDWAMPTGTRKIFVGFIGVSCDTGTRTFRIQALSAASTPDATAGNYRGFGVSNSGAAAAFLHGQASMIGAANQNAGEGIDGFVSISVGPCIGFSSEWYGDATAGNRGMMNGHYSIASAFYGLRFLWSGSGSFDAGTIQVVYS